MKVNLSRANVYLVDEVEYIVAANATQASEFYLEQVGEGYEPEIVPVNPAKVYLIDVEVEVTDEQKILYLNLNKGTHFRYHAPLKIFADEVIMNERCEFKVRRTLLQELINETAGKVMFDVPFSIASTEV
ncbi:hypothetical protein [uncultured Enterococcus sp.]|uniref:hypothetical protein n=1 Tax=uncultured Enterococcus sp. TaxID=167972 RepID=UPI002AA700F1|nr:hypothetical protein [uncultured Enterococcus sp.]